jgi:hypothetical protein
MESDDSPHGSRKRMRTSLLRKRRMREKLGLSRTPELTSMGMSDFDSPHIYTSSCSPPRFPVTSFEHNQLARPDSASVVNELTERFATLSHQLVSALELSSISPPKPRRPHLKPRYRHSKYLSKPNTGTGTGPHTRGQSPGPRARRQVADTDAE